MIRDRPTPFGTIDSTTVKEVKSYPVGTTSSLLVKAKIEARIIRPVVMDRIFVFFMILYLVVVVVVVIVVGNRVGISVVFDCK